MWIKNVVTSIKQLPPEDVACLRQSVGTLTHVHWEQIRWV